MELIIMHTQRHRFTQHLHGFNFMTFRHFVRKYSYGMTFDKASSAHKKFYHE